MAQAVGVTVEGVEDLKGDLNDLLGSIEEGCGPALAKVAERAADEARDVVPFDSGALSDSIEAGQREDEGYIEMGGGAVGYAGWIEYGGSRGRPYVPEGRYLVPTAADMADEAALSVSKETENRIGGQRWSNPDR